VELSGWSDEVEEISQQYAARFGVERTSPWFLLKLQEEVGELTQAYLQTTGQGRDKGRSASELRDDLQAEVADVLAMLLLFARHHGVDVEEALDRKWLAYRAANAPHLAGDAPA
jgi:NTP pyrophosphatase (non-canonical NTP hydrolase)